MRGVKSRGECVCRKIWHNIVRSVCLYDLYGPLLHFSAYNFFIFISYYHFFPSLFCVWCVFFLSFQSICTREHSTAYKLQEKNMYNRPWLEGFSRFLRTFLFLSSLSFFSNTDCERKTFDLHIIPYVN